VNGGLIGPEYDAQIRQTILNVRQMRIDSAEHQGKADRPEPSKFAPKYALLLDDLAAAEEFTEAPQTARARLLIRNADATLRESAIVVEVVNRTESSHAEGEYVRLKFIAGEWNILGGGGGGGEIIQFAPIDVCEGIGFTCDCVTARVVTATCGSGLSPGDEVQVWDQSRGWFQMPEDLLFRSIGWAHKVKVTEADVYEGLPFYVGDCRWVVMSMDCIEQEPAS
jgi:hypothetical protein